MSENKSSNNGDTYDMLHRSFSMGEPKYPNHPDESDVKNSGEIYFSANAGGYREPLYDLSRFDGSASGSMSASERQAASAAQRQAAAASRTAASSARQANGYGQRPVRSSAAQAVRTGGAASANVARSAGSASASRTQQAARPQAAARTQAASGTGTARQRTASGGQRTAPANQRNTAYRSGARPSSAAVSSDKNSRARASGAYAPVSDKKKRVSGKEKKRGSGFLIAALVIIVVVVASFLIRIPIMGCMNDIIAINRASTEIRVAVGQNMNTNDVIDLLKEKDLIYSAKFCKFVYKMLGHDENEIYPAGVYTVRADMGLEGMMREIITAGAKDATVSIAFPEGYTIDQIIEKLATNGVASSSALYAVIDDPSFIQQYPFLEGIDNREQRYHYLEGYLYPDTYEFYIGENPQSVIERFLKNFNDKWNQEFADRLAKTNYSMDDVLTVASILEKEANGAEQMPLVASIIYNRLESSSFPNIQCDSTAKYIENMKDKLVQSGRYASLLKVYDSYQITGLPVGPIGNPGYNAISAALSPEATDYYYFIHDDAGEIYVARNAEEHQANIAKAGLS